MIRCLRRPLRLLAVLAAAVLPHAGAQVVPAADYTDLWWGGESQSGWGISFTQHAATRKAFAVWYTYDPRTPEASTAAGADFVPLWFAMPDCAWRTATSCGGDLYVTVGSPFATPWSPAAHQAVVTGTYTFTFADANTGTFAWTVAPPAGLPATDPRAGLPASSGTKAIVRQPF